MCVFSGRFTCLVVSPFFHYISSSLVFHLHSFSLSHTQLCAIAGGVFSISRLLDNFFYYSGVFLGKGTGFLAGTPR